MDGLAVAEAYLAFCRMHIHIHLFRRQLEEQHKGRMALMMEYVLISLTYGMRDHLVADEAAIHKKILRIAGCFGIGG